MTSQTHRLFQENAQTGKYYGVFRSVSSYNCSCYYRSITWYGHVCNFKQEANRWLAHRHPARNSLQLLDTCYPTQLYYTYMRLNLIPNVSSSFTFSIYSPPSHHSISWSTSWDAAPIKEVARSKAGTVNDRSNTGITNSNPTLDTDLYVWCLQCVSSCVGT